MRRQHLPVANEEQVGVVGFGNEAVEVEHDGAVDAGDVGLDRRENVVEQIVVVNLRIEA